MTTTREPATHTMLDRCTETAHERDRLLTLHDTRHNVPRRLPTVSHCPTAQTHDATRWQPCSLWACRRLPPREPATHSMLDRCTETAHERDRLLTLHGTRQQHVPGRLPTVSHCPTPQTHDATRAGSLARCGPVAHDHTTRACHSMLDRCTETAHERDGLLTLHGTRQHEPGRLPTVSHCRTAQTHDATRGQPCSLVGLSPMTTTQEPATLDARSMHCDCA